MKANPATLAFAALITPILSAVIPLPPAGSDAHTEIVSRVADTVLSSAVAISTGATTPAVSITHHQPSNSSILDPIVERDEDGEDDDGEEIVDEHGRLVKRKGGGGRGGGRSGGSSGGSSGGRGTTSVPKTPGGISVRNVGGRTTISTPRGSYYGGGASVPYSVGRSSTPRSGLGAPFAALAISLWLGAGLWYYPHPLWYYPYPADKPWTYYNGTTKTNMTIPVGCVCQQFADCTCEYNDDPDFIKSILGNGTYNGWNSSLVSVQPINNTWTAVMNGTSNNGTTAISSWGVPAASVPSLRFLMTILTLLVAFQVLM